MAEGIPVAPGVPVGGAPAVVESPLGLFSGYQVVKLELVVSHVLGGSTSAVVLRGSAMPLPQDAVPVAPDSSPG